MFGPPLGHRSLGLVVRSHISVFFRGRADLLWVHTLTFDV